MSTHNICFHAEIRKIIFGYPSYLGLCFARVQDDLNLRMFEGTFSLDVAHLIYNE